MIHRQSRRFVLPAVTTLVMSAFASANLAEAATTAGSTSTGPTNVRTVHLRGASAAFPPSVKHTGSSAANLTEDGTLQHFVNRSHSARPRVVVDGSGRRTFAGRTVPSWLPDVASSTVTSTRPGALAGWEGLNEFDNEKYAGFSLEPPDQGLCAGNGHVLELINDTVQVYAADGTPETGVAYLNDFFEEPGFQFTTDPSCVYDAGSHRFFALQLTLDVDRKTGALTGRNWLDLAVSKTGDPGGGYRFYRIDTTDDGSSGTPSHRSCPCIGDYPHLATDAHGVFITTNEYPFSGPGVFGDGFNGAQVYAMSKAAVVSGATSPLVQFQNVRVPSVSGPRLVGHTLWPAQSAGTGYATANNGTVYFSSSFAAEEARPDDFSGHAAQLGTWWIPNTGSLDGTPHLSLHAKVLGVGDYGIPPLANQKAGPVPLKDCLNVACAGDPDPYAPEQEGALDSLDSRVLTAVYAGGTVYSALDTAMDVAGNVQAGVEWFAVHAATGRSTVADQGYLGLAHANVSFPAIATDKSGRGYMGMSMAGDRYYPSAVYTTFSSHGPGAVNVASAGKAPQDGFCEYLFFNCGGTEEAPAIRPRWGDYGAAAWDGKDFFLANEYIAHSCSYDRFVATNGHCGGTRTFFGNFSTHVQRLD